MSRKSRWTSSRRNGEGGHRELGDSNASRLQTSRAGRFFRRIQGKAPVFLATSTCNALANLKHLTIRGPPERRVQVFKLAQAYVTGLHLKEGQLRTLRITGFNHLSWFASDDIPLPEGDYSSLQVDKLELYGNDHDVAWSPRFLPIAPSSLRTLSYESYMEHKIEADALEELVGKSEGSLEVFIFRGQSLEPDAIVGSLQHYNEI